MNLIIVNYSMSSNSLVFSHQRDTAIALSRHFETVTVFTSEVSSEALPENLNVKLIKWRPNSPILNLFAVLTTLVPHLSSNRNAIVFTHMADVHAALISPFTCLLGMRHVLWYAHATNSLFLNFASFFVNKIVSSTSGSCNLGINTFKVQLINQGINQNDFPFQIPKLLKMNKLFYYGRLDQSKNIHLFPSLIEMLTSKKSNFTIDIFGQPTSKQPEKYIVDLKLHPIVCNANSKVKFHGPIERKQIPWAVSNFGVFVNLFSGSLDKTLIEATFMGKSVVTWNQEYCRAFGTWSGMPVAETLEFIAHEIYAIESLSASSLSAELQRRLNIGIKLHSFDGWVVRLVSVLQEGFKS